MSFNRFLNVVLSVVSIVCGSAIAAGAATYTYAGNSFATIQDNPSAPFGTYTTSMGISGSFTVASALAPNLNADITADILSLSFFDGRSVLNDLANIGVFEIQTNTSGTIVGWEIRLSASEGSSLGDQSFYIETYNIPSFQRDIGRVFECTLLTEEGCAGGQDRGYSDNNPGIWSVVPEPSTALLMGLGLAGLAGKPNVSSPVSRLG